MLWRSFEDEFGPKWSPAVWETSTGTQPGMFFGQLHDKKDRLLQSSNKYKAKAQTQQQRWKRKMQSLKTNSTKKARKSYGPEAEDVSDDISENELGKLKQNYLSKHINISSNQIKQITSSTCEQSLSGLWHSERKKRLTASNFGPVYRRNTSLPVKKLVENLLYSKFNGNRHTKNGLLQERSTIEEYKLKKAEENINLNVTNSGLVILEQSPFLAASPDGIVTTSTGETGLLEIKNLLHSKPINLFQAAETSNFCLKKIDGALKLKTNHNYFFQCHGLLNICKKPWIDFVVRTLNPYQLYIERIFRDEKLWNDTMLPKLTSFYLKCILPELCSPRVGKVPGIREPGVWYVSPVSQLATTKKPRKTTRKTTKLKKKRKKMPASDIESSVDDDPQNEPIPSISQRRCWIVNESTGKKEWYKGTVLSVISGKDGTPDAVYEVWYDRDEEPFKNDHLVSDHKSLSVRFIDV